MALSIKDISTLRYDCEGATQRILDHAAEYDFGGLDRVVQEALRFAWWEGRNYGQRDMRASCERHLLKERKAMAKIFKAQPPEPDDGAD